MLRFLQHHEIDLVRWDKLVSAQSNPCIFNYSWYLSATSKKWGAVILNDYEAAFPIVIKNKMGLNYISQPIFSRYFSIIKTNEINITIEDIINAIPYKLFYIDICVPLENNISTLTATNKTFQILKLNTAHQDLFTNYSKNHKRNISKANDAHLFIEKGIDLEIFENNFSLLIKQKKLGLQREDKENFRTLIQAAQKYAIVYLYSVKNNSNTIQSAAIFIGIDNKLLYLKGYTNESGKKNGAMHFLFDEVIKEFSMRYESLDFGGSNILTIASFFKGFGGKDVVYLHIKQNNLPSIFKWMKK